MKEHGRPRLLDELRANGVNGTDALNSHPLVRLIVAQMAYLAYPHEDESALARLQDLFRLGVRGQVFRDFVEVSRNVGKTDGDILREWQESEKVVMS